MMIFFIIYLLLVIFDSLMAVIAFSKLKEEGSPKFMWGSILLMWIVFIFYHIVKIIVIIGGM